MSQLITAIGAAPAPAFLIFLSIVTLIAIGLLRPRLTARPLNWLLLGRWVLIPYFGLLAGVLSPRLMGLGTLDWPAGLILGGGVLLTFLLVLPAVRTTLALNAKQPLAVQESSSQQSWLLTALTFIHNGAEQFHWCFLRSAVWAIWLAAPQAPQPAGYWAVWAAALLTLPEILLIRSNGWSRLLSVSVLIVTTVLFFYTRNFWLCWAVHGVLWASFIAFAADEDVSPRVYSTH